MSNLPKCQQAPVASRAHFYRLAAASDGINAVEWFGLLSALSTALGVYAFPNAPMPPE